MVKIYPQLLAKSDPRYQIWRQGLTKRPPVWNKGKTKFNNTSVKKISDSFKLKRIDNFAAWRTKARLSNKIPNTTISLKRNKALAFLIGLILGDGNIYQYQRTQGLKITLGTDKPKLWQHVSKLMTKVFKKEPGLYFPKTSASVYLNLYQKNLDQRLQIPPGPKKKLNLKFPKWVWQKKQFIIATLKGLFEAEGSLSIHKKSYTYNLSFSNYNKGLLDAVEKALKLLNFHPERRVNAIRLRRKNEVERFIELIKFRTYP